MRPKRSTVEHLVRLEDGGSFHISNLVLACSGCNSGRGSFDVSFWKKYRLRIQQQRNKAKRVYGQTNISAFLYRHFNYTGPVPGFHKFRKKVLKPLIYGWYNFPIKFYKIKESIL